MNATQHRFGNYLGAASSKRSIAAVSIIAGVVVCLLSFAVERAMMEAPRRPIVWMDWADQVIAGIATALCIYAVWNNARREQLLNQQRFELISASTQQIRDALQLITDSAPAGTSQQRIVMYAVDHIEWVLEEVLPTVHQDPKEVQNRLKQHAALPGEKSQIGPSGEYAGEPDSQDSKFS